MNHEYSLRLRVGTSSVDIATDHLQLWLTLGHIYRAFAVEPLPDLAAASVPSSVGDLCAYVDSQCYHFTEFYLAVEELKDAIADRLLPKIGNPLLLHAAVAHDDRHTIFLIGPSGSGKTTLGLELVRRGMRYITDEFAIIHGQRLQPFPRSATQKFKGPLPAGANLVIQSGSAHRAYCLPNHRGGLDSVAIAENKLIVFPTHSQQENVSVRGLGTAEASAMLMCSTFDIKGRVREVWPDLVDILAGSKVCSFCYRDAETDLDIALKFLKSN